MLHLLAEDVADIPTDLLERAIQRHVAASPYMPKAADLIQSVLDFDRQARVQPMVRTGSGYAHDLAESYNAARHRTDVEWYVDHAGAVKIRYLTERPDQPTPAIA